MCVWRVKGIFFVLYILLTIVLSEKVIVERTTSESSESSFIDFPENLYFNKGAPCLYTLKVPAFLETLDVCRGACQIQEKEALKSFFYSTGGEKWWHTRTHWLNDSVHHCRWHGISCCNRTKHVLAITLPRNRLRGVLGDALRGLKYLLGLCLGRNEMQGNLYSIYSSLSPHILRVDLAYTEVDGDFHQSGVTEKLHLQKIQLSGSRHVGGIIPNNINLLKNLVVLSLGETNIRGRVPWSISALVNLFFLDLETLHMTGDLEMFREMTKLQYLHLSANKIRGRIPVNLGFLYPDMIELHLQSNYIVGWIPRSIGHCSCLTQFHVGSNIGIKGFVPKEIGMLQKLKIFSVAWTAVSGFEKGFAFDSPVLGLFSISHLKNFEITTRTLLQMLSKANRTLMHLDAEYSQIHGTIDETIFNFPFLTLLNLEGNQIFGKLPDPIENLEYLSNINLRYNNFSGSLPSSFTKLQMLQQLDLRNNVHLKGDIDQTFLLADFQKLSKPEYNINFVCPEIRFTHNNGIVHLAPGYYDMKYCLCSIGYYGLGGYCKHCLDGGFCPGVTGLDLTQFNLTTPLRNFSAITKMDMLIDYWPFPLAHNVEKFLRCPATDLTSLCNNDGKCSCVLKLYSKKKFVTTCNDSYVCRQGHRGRFCSQCQKYYYMAGQLCFKCPQGSNKAVNIGGIVGSSFVICLSTLILYFVGRKSLKVAFTLLVIKLAALVVCVLTSVLPLWLLQFAVVLNFLVFGGHLSSCQGIFKSIVFYFQTVDSLLSSWDSWPPTIFHVQSYISSAFNLHFSTMACYFTALFDEVVRYAILYSLPLMLAVILSLVYLVRGLILYCRRTTNDNLSEAQFKFRRLFLLFIDFAFFPIAKSALRIVVPCKTASSPSSTVSYMANFVWIDCSCLSYIRLKALAVSALVIYTVGIPYLLYGFLLYKNRNKIREGAEDVQQWLGCLYKPFKDQFRLYLEILLITKRLLMAMGLALLPAGQPIQTVILVFFLLLFLAFDCYAEPFKSFKPLPKCMGNAGKIGIENLLSSCTSLVLIVSFVFLRVHNVGDSPVSFYFAVTLNALLLLSYVGAILFMLVPQNNAQQEDEQDLQN